VSERDEIAQLLGFEDWNEYMTWWHRDMDRHANATGPKIIITTKLGSGF
jgi:hypothetical protein